MEIRNSIIIDGIIYIRKDALLEFINEKLQELADRLDFCTNHIPEFLT